MQISIREECADCGGKGAIAPTYRTCEPCKGTGWIEEWISLRDFLRLVAELVIGR